MADTLTDDITFSHADQTDPASIPTNGVWEMYEPNTVDSLGNNFSVTRREFIGSGGQPGSGVVTGKSVSLGFSGDWTWASGERTARLISYADAPLDDVVWRGGVSVSSGSYTVPEVTTSARNKLDYSSNGAKTLFYARGFLNESNNGLKVLGAAQTSGTSIRVAGTLNAESDSPQTTLEVCGVQFGSGEAGMSVTGTTGRLTETGASDLRTLGLEPGQIIAIGGDDEDNRFDTGFGFARISSIEANALIFDYIEGTLATDAGAGKEIQIFYNRNHKNVRRSNPLYNRISQVVETRFPGLGPNGETLNEYQVGNIAGDLTITITNEDKITFTMNSIGINSLNVVDDSNRANNADSARTPVGVVPYSTGTHLHSVVINTPIGSQNIDEFREFTISINRNVNPSGIIGQLDPRRINNGILSANFNGTGIYNSTIVTRSINENLRVSLIAILVNEDGGFAIQIPNATLSDGSRNFATGEEVTVAINGIGERHLALDTTFIISLFPHLPGIYRPRPN